MRESLSAVIYGTGRETVPGLRTGIAVEQPAILAYLQWKGSGRIEAS